MRLAVLEEKSRRKYEIADRILEGKSLKEIAREMGVSYGHVTNVVSQMRVWYRYFKNKGLIKEDKI